MARPAAVPAPAAGHLSLAETSLQSSLFGRSFFVAFTNVKAWLFFAAFLPQFVDPSKPQAPQYMLLAVVFVLIDVMVLMGYAILGAGATIVLKGSTVIWIDRLSGFLLLVLAVVLLLYQRGHTS